MATARSTRTKPGLATASAVEATATRSYLPAQERRTRLLDAGVALVREKGWAALSVADLARRSGVSRQLVHQYFGDLERLALEIAERFEDEVHGAAVRATERHPDDFRSAMRETLERFLVGLREERLAYGDLVVGHTFRHRLRPPLNRVRSRKRRRLVDVWARYFEQVNGLSARDARALSSFQYDGLRGLVGQVDSGQLSPQEAIHLFLEVLEAAIERLGGRARRAGASRGVR